MPNEEKKQQGPATLQQAGISVSTGVTNDNRIVVGTTPPSAMFFLDLAAAERHANEILRLVKGLRAGLSPEQLKQGSPK